MPEISFTGIGFRIGTELAALHTHHAAVKTALVKDGWSITHDPLFIRSLDIEMYIDLGAEKIIGAEKGDRKIAVEIKSFVGTSSISEFHTALGQFLNYRMALEDQEPDRVLYLAITTQVFQAFFAGRFIQKAVRAHQLRLVVFDPEDEEIEQWQTC